MATLFHTAMLRSSGSFAWPEGLSQDVLKKGHSYALDAVAAVCAGGRDGGLAVSGRGPLFDPMRGHVVALGPGDRVAFLGARTQDEVVTLMVSSHMLPAASVTVDRFLSITHADRNPHPPTFGAASAATLGPA